MNKFINNTIAKYQMICVGNFERMLKLKNPLAATVRSLAKDAKDRQCLVSSSGVVAFNSITSSESNKWTRDGKRQLDDDDEGDGGGGGGNSDKSKSKKSRKNKINSPKDRGEK